MDLADTVPKERWLDFDLAVLAICKRLFVLKLEGWENSPGVQKEITFARSLQIPIQELEPPSEEKFLFLVRPALFKGVSTK